MKRRKAIAGIAVILFLVLSLSLPAQANSQAEDVDRIRLGGLARGPVVLGSGIFIGEPSGISGKLWFPETGFGVDLLAAWSFGQQDSLYLHSSAIYHLALIETEGGRYISPSVGLGVLGRLGEESSVGIRLPVGLSLFLFPSFPMEIYGEISPGVGIYPATNEEFGYGFGARFYLPIGSQGE